ncbi:hypothetical protein BOX15_Mlig019424g1 [Macrostomum lignano]|uniref:Uncharacterized protein n=2 Tax=Macrostomum lignano TaxID=282301 RepID=A0A267E287_9PLAT|nr:hypothetical protein BOX15_Mlig009008g2 [Macrostomum lignano]PAA77500.1 hypothetical protein BOX15_Mlig008221g3 [Macrostomum lignano]PAA77911.1 hypothetical protein BOX15_Mlig019424g1 [Macrostomum lignano]
MSALVKSVASATQSGIRSAGPKLSKFWRYARVELKPPTPAEVPQISAEFGKLMQAARRQNWRELTVAQCLVSTGVAVEVACWFFFGEIIGRRSIIGYSRVPHGFHVHSL